jgi:hypothetical protein
MTTLVDVMLLILIIFMVTAPISIHNAKICQSKIYRITNGKYPCQPEVPAK